MDSSPWLKEPEKITSDEFTAAMAWAQSEMENESEAGNHLAVILSSIGAVMERKTAVQPKPAPKQKILKKKPVQKIRLESLRSKIPDGAMTIRDMAEKVEGLSHKGMANRLNRIKAKPCARVAYLTYYSKEDFEKVCYPVKHKETTNV